MHTNNSAVVTAPRPRTSQLRRAAAIAGAAALALLGLGLGASPALAHDQLVGQSVVTSSGDGSVTGVKLSFNNEVLEVGSEISVTDQSGNNAADGGPVVSGRDVVQGITQPASEGTYSIEWRVVSSDGHPIQGEMALTIDSSGAGTITVVEEAHDHDDENENESGDAADADHDDADHDHGDHDHGDEADEEILPISADNEGNDPVITTVIIVLIVVVAAGAAVAIVIGSKRRREAMNKAIEEAKENDSE